MQRPVVDLPQPVERTWHRAGNRLEATPARGYRIDARNRADQPLRIWMGRLRSLTPASPTGINIVSSAFCGPR